MTYRLREDALVAPITVLRLLDLGVGRFRVDDAILASNRLAIPLAVVGLLALKVLELLLERALEVLDLALLEAVAGVAPGIPFQKLDLVLDLRVADLRLRDNGLELGGGAVVGRGQHALVDVGDGLDVGRELVDALLCARDAREEVFLAEGARAMLLSRAVPTGQRHVGVRHVLRRLGRRRRVGLLGILHAVALASAARGTGQEAPSAYASAVGVCRPVVAAIGVRLAAAVCALVLAVGVAAIGVVLLRHGRCSVVCALLSRPR